MNIEHNLYALASLPQHLFECGQHQVLINLLEHYVFLERKLEVFDVQSLIDDFLLLDSPRLKAIGDTLRRAAHYLNDDASLFPGQLLAYLDPSQNPWLKEKPLRPRGDWLRPLHPGMEATDQALIRTFSGHTDAVSDLVVLPDGSRAISGSWDATLIVWQLQTGRVEHVLRGHWGLINEITLSEDGKHIYSCSDDGTIRQWDPFKGSEIRVWTVGEGAIVTLGKLPRQRFLLGLQDGSLLIWNLGSHQIEWKVKAHNKEILSVAICPEGKLAASSAESETSDLRVWDLVQKAQLAHLDSNEWEVSKIAFDADGRRIVGCDNSGFLMTWDRNLGSQTKMRTNLDCTHTLCLSPNKRLAACGSGEVDHTLRVWDLAQRKELWLGVGHSEAVYALSFLPDGRHLLSGSFDSTIKLWDTQVHNQPQDQGSSSMEFVVCAPDERCVITGSTGNFSYPWSDPPQAKNVLRVWDPATGKLFGRLEGHKNAVLRGLFLNKAFFISSSSDHSLILWDLKTLRAFRQFVGHQDYVTDVYAAADGKRMVSASADQSVIIWDLKSGQALHHLKGHQDIIWSIVVDTLGTCVVSGGADGIRTWDLETGHSKHYLADGEMAAARKLLVWENYIISGDLGGHLRIWDVKRGIETMCLRKDENMITDLALLDKQRLVSSSDNGALTVWNLIHGKALFSIEAHKRSINGLSVTKNKQYMVTASNDKSVKLWCTKTGKRLAAYYGEAEFLCCATCSEGQRIIAGDQLDRIHFFRWEHGK